MLKGKVALVYAAGIIDGEGCIGLYKKKATDCKLGYHLVVKVQVGNTQEWLIRWLQMQFGGCITYSHCKLKSWKPQWRWIIAANKATECLKLVLPYLQLKRPQAEIVIQYQKNRHRGRNAWKTPEQIALEEAQYLLMQNLNRRGVEHAI